MLNKLLLIVIICLTVYILWDKGCNIPEPIVNTVTIVDTIPGDSIPIPYPVIVPQEPIVITVPEYIPSEVDTAYILRDYFSKVYGRDTLANDSSILVIIDWIISENRFKEIIPFIANRKPTSIIHKTYNTYPIPKYSIGIGIGIPQGYYLSTSYGPGRLKARATYLNINKQNHFLIGADYNF